jgi:hypothetical protein
MTATAASAIDDEKVRMFTWMLTPLTNTPAKHTRIEPDRRRTRL